MRAGSLRYTLWMLRREKRQSPSGFVSEEWATLYTCRAQKVRQWSLRGDGFQAKEQFDGERLQFRVRYDKRLNEVQRIRFEGAEYRITLKDPNAYDNSVVLTCVLIDG